MSGFERSTISKRPIRPGTPGGRARAADTSMTERGGKSGRGYYRPSPEMVEASRARRAAQKAEGPALRAERQFRRKPGVLPPLRTHIKAGPAATVIEGAALAGLAGVAVHRSRQVSKADGDKRRVVAGTVGGVAAADAVSMAGGQTAKAVLTRRRIARGESPHEAKIWNDHKASHGIVGRSTSKTSNAAKVAAHSTYPKSLPDWRGQRALAFKNKPAVYGATLAAGAAAGAALVRRGNRKVSKGMAIPAGLKIKKIPAEVITRTAFIGGSGAAIGLAARKPGKASR